MKDLKISKELLNAVLGHNDICNERIIQNKLLYMCKNDGMIDYEYEYNIYEFAFKCKEWAFKRELNLWTDYLGNCQIQGKDFQLLHDCYSDTEIEATIKACEWVLENESHKENNLCLKDNK